MRKWVAPTIWAVLSFILVMFISSALASWGAGNRPYQTDLATISLAIFFLISAICFWGCRITKSLHNDNCAEDGTSKNDSETDP